MSTSENQQGQNGSENSRKAKSTTPKVLTPSVTGKLIDLGPVMEPLLRDIRKVGEDLSEKFTAQIMESKGLRQMMHDLSSSALEVNGPLAGQETNTAYSPDFKSPADYFGPHEKVINSFDDLHNAIQQLTEKNGELDFVWRGQQDASWGLHSSLYRILMEKNGVQAASKPHRLEEPYPSEREMVEAEEQILRLGRSLWRFDDLNALELFARLQHFGAPTRLLDVSRNPYVAAWFATEYSERLNDKDGRLFAAATLPALPSPQSEEAKRLTQVSGETAIRHTPFWHATSTNADRIQLRWGTGSVRRIWVPPLFEQRILAQNGAFLIDGVPLFVPETNVYFKRKVGSTQKPWKKADLLASASIYTKLYNPSRTVPINHKRSFPATFTYRITSTGKEDIRRTLEKNHSYRAATLYPDIEGLATYLQHYLPSLLG